MTTKKFKKFKKSIPQQKKLSIKLCQGQHIGIRKLFNIPERSWVQTQIYQYQRKKSITKYNKVADLNVVLKNFSKKPRDKAHFKIFIELMNVWSVRTSTYFYRFNRVDDRLIVKTFLEALQLADKKKYDQVIERMFGMWQIRANTVFNIRQAIIKDVLIYLLKELSPDERYHFFPEDAYLVRIKELEKLIF